MLLKRIKPNAKCAVTRSACNFSLMTMAPNVICPTTAAAAIIENILVDLSELCPFSTNAIVKKINSPVLAARVLWMYSIINSYDGINPCGHKGQWGQDNPTPEELTYPPNVIKLNKTQSAPMEKI